MDATKLFLRPGRLTRPGKICVILRGLPGACLRVCGRRPIRRTQTDVDIHDAHTPCRPIQSNPGSGKTHLARMLRDIERGERGACRILCLDDYFLQVRGIVEPIAWRFVGID